MSAERMEGYVVSADKAVERPEVAVTVDDQAELETILTPWPSRPTPCWPADPLPKRGGVCCCSLVATPFCSPKGGNAMKDELRAESEVHDQGAGRGREREMSFYQNFKMSSLDPLQRQSDDMDAAVFEAFKGVLDKRRQELDATILFCHTMYEYLRRKGILDEDEFKALYDEIDLSDGSRDHRAADKTLPATEGSAGG